MRRRTKWAIAIAGLAVTGIVASRPILDYLAQRKAQLLLCPERIQIMLPEQTVKLINPKPQSTVLDLGAGFGFFTFPLAQAVGRNGKVFATDVENQVVEYLANRARRLNYPNVTPVRVTPDGFDSFYSSQTFDVILASDVILYLPELETFITKLRPQLREGSGRLWVIEKKCDPDFTVIEFTDSATLAKVLRSLGNESPIIHRFRPLTRQTLAATPSGGAKRASSGSRNRRPESHT
jgi:protein-L-isoaspartate O-methyltransferase